MLIQTEIQGVLFDLDGTLADTAPDLGGALNDLLARYDRPLVPLSELRPLCSMGARGMIQRGFDLTPADPYFDELREQYLECYAERLVKETTLFEGVIELIDALEEKNLAWGIVTNKFERYAKPLVAAIPTLAKTGILVGGDTYDKPKPYPDPLLGAASQLKLNPAKLLYVGDDERDMQAAEAAGMAGIVARYGYLGVGNPPDQWSAAGHIDHPLGLLNFLA